KLLGTEIQLIKSIPRQGMLVIFGLLLLAGSGLIHVGDNTEPQPAGKGGAHGGGPRAVGGGAGAESGRLPRTRDGGESRGTGGTAGLGDAGETRESEGGAAAGGSKRGPGTVG